MKDENRKMKPTVILPISMAVEPEGFGERDFFAEVDTEVANDEQEKVLEVKNEPV